MSALSEILKESLENKALTLDKLAETSDVPKRYLEALISGEYKKLPPAPYVHGYILKIAKVLRIDGEELWETYKHDLPLKIAGENDKLASNRYALPVKSKRLIVFLIILIFVILYLGFNWRSIFGIPKLEIISPSLSESTISTSTLKVIGYIDPKDKLLINNEEVVVDSSGRFEKDYNLQEGLNTIEFKVKKFLGKENKIIREINYKP